MPANTLPIFPITPKISFGKVDTANTALDGTGTTVLLFTAGANGARIDQITVEHLGTNVATVLRLFVNNGADPTTATNNSLNFERTIVANTISQEAESVGYDLTLEKDGGSLTLPPIPYLPATYRVYGSVGTTIAAGVQVTVFGGDY
jgi:hypothetical protein